MTTVSKRITVEERLRALYDLQLIDSQIDKITDMRGELPLEVQDLEDEISGLQIRIDKVQAEIADLDIEIKNKKNAIKDSNALIKKYEEQQQNVRNNREFEALSKEIEYQTLEIQLSEKRIKEYQAQAAMKNQVLEEIVEKMNGRKADLDHKKSELDNILEETRKEEETLLRISEEYASKIEPRMLAAYKKIRASHKNGLAVVAIERGASGGSFFKIPPQTQIEVANRKRILVSEFDGRILVDPELAAEEEDKIRAIIEGIR